jgi:hypothetical protein
LCQQYRFAATRKVVRLSGGWCYSRTLTVEDPRGEEHRMADLDVGQRIPYFELPDQQDYPWSLSGQLEVGPVVLIFYRGDW